ncbi:putative olfactory receptor 10D4 [Carettochelys insculpta]|uniref:putative olfactory receptor 10D4 n=1 Tax=Carettochelys insculpta TaxID=44489 RepID=UPI003EC001F0
MGPFNHTVVTHFILLGIPNTDGLDTILFFTFLAFYLCTLLGNLLILSAVVADSRLHTPMYFFLCNLAVLDIGLSSVNIPKYLANLWAQSRTIGLGGCMAQVFFYHFLASTESLLYTVMALDRYVAICHPLRYFVIMNHRVSALLAAGTWFCSSFHATILASLTFTLPYCGSNVVDYFFCDIFPVVELACADTYVLEAVTFTNIGMVPMTCFVLILASYVRIIYSILKMTSGEGRRKAASTCSSHLVVVIMFFGPCALVYTQPQLSKVWVTTLDVFGNLVTPMLNPLIYTLRNKEVNAGLRKLVKEKRVCLQPFGPASLPAPRRLSLRSCRGRFLGPALRSPELPRRRWEQARVGTRPHRRQPAVFTSAAAAAARGAWGLVSCPAAAASSAGCDVQSPGAATSRGRKTSPALLRPLSPAKRSTTRATHPAAEGSPGLHEPEPGSKAPGPALRCPGTALERDWGHRGGPEEARSSLAGNPPPVPPRGAARGPAGQQAGTGGRSLGWTELPSATATKLAFKGIAPAAPAPPRRAHTERRW